MPPLIEDTERQVVVHEGDVAVLQCRAHGSPPPRISWIHNGRIPIQTGGRYEILESGALRISDIQVRAPTSKPDATCICALELSER